MTVPLTGLRLPDHHPYIAVTPEGLALAKERIARFPWAKETLKRMIEAADGDVAKPLGKLPPKSDEKHWHIADTLLSVGIAYAFTGDRKYADWVRDGLVAYADIYPGLPITNGRCKVFSQSSLYEAMWACSIAQAYDLVADSGAFTPEQIKHIETDLLRQYVTCFKVDDYENDPRIKDLHYRCYNFQAWHIAAVGLAGLALKDPELVQWAVNSRYGFAHLIAHDIRDDGLFWERSIGYHHFVVTALMPFTEGMAHCGVDLYHFQAPNQRVEVESCHYPTDTTDTPKSFRLMLEAPFYAAFPDLSYPALGDSDRGPLRASWLHLATWNHYHDQKLAWLLERDMPLAQADTHRGRVGFLHYYRYNYRHENVRLDGRPVKWGQVDETYDVHGDKITTNDAGASQPDHYLLNDTDARDFTFDFTTTRLTNSGEMDRSWLVYHAYAKDPANRMAFMLVSYCPEINRPYHFRLEVKGDSARLLRDGTLVSDKPISYVAAPDWHWLVSDLPPTGLQVQHPDFRDGTFANSGQFRNGCSLLPATGLAVLRQASGDFTAQPNTTAAALSCGPYGGGHGHPDKMSLVVYAQGRQWIPLYGSMPYESHWKAEWTAHTVSANTVVIDGISQKPTGTVDQGWPSDSGDNRSVGRIDRFDPAAKLASGVCDSAYDGVSLRRTVRLHGLLVIDQFSIDPHDKAAAHQFDYVLHIDGEFADSTTPLRPRSGTLGTRCGYQYVEQKAGADISDVTAVAFEYRDKRLCLWIVPLDGAPTEVIVADGLTTSPTAKGPMVILRRKGIAARYLTVIEPVDNKMPLTAVSTENAGPGKWPTLILTTAAGRQRVPLQ